MRKSGYVERGRARMVSRNGNVFKSFGTLTAAVGASVAATTAILDGEIVCLGRDGRPRFSGLMRRREPQHFMAFDLLWMNGRDLRGLPLAERKRLLLEVVPPQPSCICYVDHVAGSGVELFHTVCERDLEGIVAKLARGAYTPEASTWIKIKNRAYTQAVGRADLFDRRGSRAAAT